MFSNSKADKYPVASLTYSI